MTGQPVSEIEKVMERDYYMSPEEALSFGLVDKVIAHHNSSIEESKEKATQ